MLNSSYIPGAFQKPKRQYLIVLASAVLGSFKHSPTVFRPCLVLLEENIKMLTLYTLASLQYKFLDFSEVVV